MGEKNTEELLLPSMRGKKRNGHTASAKAKDPANMGEEKDVSQQNEAHEAIINQKKGMQLSLLST